MSSDSHRMVMLAIYTSRSLQNKSSIGELIIKAYNRNVTPYSIYPNNLKNMKTEFALYQCHYIMWRFLQCFSSPARTFAPSAPMPFPVRSSVWRSLQYSSPPARAFAPSAPMRFQERSSEWGSLQCSSPPARVFAPSSRMSFRERCSVWRSLQCSSPAARVFAPSAPMRF